MTSSDDLTAALRNCATGVYPLEAGTELLIANGTFLHRGDFTSRFITTGTSISDGMRCPTVPGQGSIRMDFLKGTGFSGGTTEEVFS